MNTTTDREGNILNYEEEANVFLEKDESNFYSKKKNTKLTDITNETKSLNPEVYKSKLNKLLPYLKPYFKYDELFTKEDFEEILLFSREGPKALKKIKSKRKLQEYNQLKYILEESLLSYRGISGINLEIDMINNLGIGNEFMEAKLQLQLKLFRQISKFL